MFEGSEIVAEVSARFAAWHRDVSKRFINGTITEASFTFRYKNPILVVTPEKTDTVMDCEVFMQER